MVVIIGEGRTGKPRMQGTPQKASRLSRVCIRHHALYGGITLKAGGQIVNLLVWVRSPYITLRAINSADRNSRFERESRGFESFIALHCRIDEIGKHACLRNRILKVRVLYSAHPNPWGFRFFTPNFLHLMGLILLSFG